MSTLTIQQYNASQTGNAKELCEFLESHIQKHLLESTSKVWHGGPVWFIDDNPVVGYWTRKDNKVQVLFWSGHSFDEEGLHPEGKFKASGINYTTIKEINSKDFTRWLKKAKDIQWDYKNIVKKKGKLERIY